VGCSDGGQSGYYVVAEEPIERALDVARASGDTYTELFAENQSGWVAFQRGDIEREGQVYERTYQHLAQLNEPLHLVSRMQLALALHRERESSACGGVTGQFFRVGG
jgi:hypothetical protein